MADHVMSINDHFIFQPLLSCFREELGYKALCEQVSHHPPISAFHVSATDYTVFGAINPKLKFWGKSVEITPKGMSGCQF